MVVPGTLLAHAATDVNYMARLVDLELKACLLEVLTAAFQLLIAHRRALIELEHNVHLNFIARLAGQFGDAHHRCMRAGLLDFLLTIIRLGVLRRVFGQHIDE